MWNGTDVTLDGSLELDSVSIFRQPSGQAYQITRLRGPIAFKDSQFVAGTVDAILPRKSDDIDDEKRIRGDLIDGSVFLDPTAVDFKRWRQQRKGAMPAYSIFAKS